MKWSMMRDSHFSAKLASIPLTVERKKIILKEARPPHNMVKFIKVNHNHHKCQMYKPHNSDCGGSIKIKREKYQVHITNTATLHWTEPVEIYAATCFVVEVILQIKDLQVRLYLCQGISFQTISPTSQSQISSWMDGLCVRMAGQQGKR